MEQKRVPGEIQVTSPSPEDLNAVRSILEKSLIDENGPIEEEIVQTLHAIEESMYEDGDTPKRYLVARDKDGTPVGVMGVTRPDDEMRAYAENPDSAIELINAFVNPDIRGSGIGEKLVSALCEEAVVRGATEVVVNSGPRYRDTGWGFWSRLMGEPKVLKDRYGPGLDAMVWRKAL